MSNDLFPHVVIRASAGTGKTYQLTNRFIGLLRSGVAPQQILATTFTRKAAGEIFDRVLLRLAQAATNDAARADLSRAIRAETPLDSDECLELLASTVRGMDSLRIGTLDSFFARVATTFALEMGLPPGWNICDELTDAQLRDEAIEAVLAREKTSDLLALMNLLTKGEAKRGIADLVSSTVSQLYALYRETQPEAWQQLERTKGLSTEELAQTVDALQRVSFSGTACGKARDKDCAAALAGDWASFVKTGLGSKVLAGETTYSRQELPADVIALYNRLLTHAASQIIGQIALQTQGTFELLKKFSEEYDRLKHQRRALRFDDVTHRLAHAMGQAADQMAYRLDSNISHVLLDEFQDTSLTQWRVLRPIAQKVTKIDGSFFCVGDTKQAIYGWRGGIAELFDGLNDELQGLTQDALTQSYRSCPFVIDTVNRVFDRMLEHGSLDRLEPAVRVWKQHFPKHTTARVNFPGYVCLRSAPEATEDQDAKDVLYQFTAQQVARSVAACPGKSVGILVRTNDAVTRLIHYLREEGVAASEEGGNPLTDSAPVELIMSVLRLADHPGDTVARFHVAHSPLAEPLGIDRWNRDELAATTSFKLRQRLIDEGYGPVIYDWARTLAPQCSKRDLSRLQQLVELAYQYQPRSSLRADDFLALIEKQKVADPTQDDVRVMTIHQSKGLQFDIVYLPELDARILGQNEWFVAGRPQPNEPVDVVCRYVNQDARRLLPQRIQQLFEDTVRQDVNEALCVLYVAMTRAVHELQMIVAPHDKQELPKTFAGLLRGALCDERILPPDTCAFECGDAHWHDKLPPAKELPSVAEEVIDVQPPKISFAASPARRRGLERASPSQLEGGQKMWLADVFRPQASEARRYGTLIHAWMQHVQWADDGLPTTEALMTAAKQLAGEIGDISHELKSLASDWRVTIAQPNIDQVLRKSYYAAADGFTDKPLLKRLKQGDLELDVHNERSFAVRDNGQMLVGTIDRLVLIRSKGKLIAADVIDFKTDQLPRDNPQMFDERVQFYQPQLAAYRRAVAQLYQLDLSAVAARLVLLVPGEVRTVS